MDELAEHYDYDLPDELIAQHPLDDRAASRLLVVHKQTGRIEHRDFPAVLEYARPGDVWVFNDTRVFPARLFARKATGARVELLFLEPGIPWGHDPKLNFEFRSCPRNSQNEKIWNAMARPGRRLRAGTELFVTDEKRPSFRITQKIDDGSVCVELLIDENLFSFLERHGEVPLPPYIHEKGVDPNRYQTVYAAETGSSAAPTAGLHFTPELRAQLAEIVETKNVTLHIGMATFRPMATERVADHAMHRELAIVPLDTAAAVSAAKREGRRVVAVGTTSVRALESWAVSVEQPDGALAPLPHAAHTELFIRAGHRFRAVDALLTNFHLPRSTLLVLVSALAGRGLILDAYQQAIQGQYRFFSFGDAMLIV